MKLNLRGSGIGRGREWYPDSLTIAVESILSELYLHLSVVGVLCQIRER